MLWEKKKLHIHTHYGVAFRPRNFIVERRRERETSRSNIPRPSSPMAKSGSRWNTRSFARELSDLWTDRHWERETPCSPLDLFASLERIMYSCERDSEGTVVRFLDAPFFFALSLSLFFYFDPTSIRTHWLDGFLMGLCSAKVFSFCSALWPAGLLRVFACEGRSLFLLFHCLSAIWGGLSIFFLFWTVNRLEKKITLYVDCKFLFLV